MDRKSLLHRDCERMEGGNLGEKQEEENKESGELVTQSGPFRGSLGLEKKKTASSK